MKNKFYLLKKPRTFIFVQIMLVFGLFTGSLQAQVPTHIWSGGTGDWNDANNWNVVAATTQNSTSTIGSTTLTLSAPNAAIAVETTVQNNKSTMIMQPLHIAVKPLTISNDGNSIIETGWNQHRSEINNKTFGELKNKLKKIWKVQKKGISLQPLSTESIQSETVGKELRRQNGVMETGSKKL